MTTSRLYLEKLETEDVHKHVADIRVGTIFFGNPKYPVGKLPAYSAAMGEGLWVRTPKGVAGFHEGSGYDGQETMHGWVVEGYVPVDADLLRIVAHLKKQNVELRSVVKVMWRDVEELERLFAGQS